MIYIVGLVALPVICIAMQLRALWKGAREDRSVGGYVCAILGTLGVIAAFVMMIYESRGIV